MQAEDEAVDGAVGENGENDFEDDFDTTDSAGEDADKKVSFAFRLVVLVLMAVVVIVRRRLARYLPVFLCISLSIKLSYNILHVDLQCEMNFVQIIRLSQIFPLSVLGILPDLR